MKIEITVDSPELVPIYGTEDASGMDLRSSHNEVITVAPSERIVIKTGLRMAIPSGYEGQVRSRSGLSLKKGLVVLNSPGTIDADYRGEIGVILINQSCVVQYIKPLDRIAQLVIAPVCKAELETVLVLDETKRNGSGWGSTGNQ